MTMTARTEARELTENARAAVAPFVTAWRALDSGLTDADRVKFEHVLTAPRPERTLWERSLKPANLALCWAKEQIAEGARDALLEYPDAGITFEGELAQ